MKPTICEKCPAYDCEGPVWGSGNEVPNLIVVGEAPGWNEVQSGEGFVGKSGNLLWMMARKANLERADCFVTNICHCNTKNIAAIDYCYKNITKPELAKLPENTPILALGDIAKTFLAPEVAHIPITSIRGSRHGRVFFALHPAYIHRLVTRASEDAGDGQGEKQDLTATLAYDIYEATHHKPVGERLYISPIPATILEDEG